MAFCELLEMMIPTTPLWFYVPSQSITLLDGFEGKDWIPAGRSLELWL
jgi:hypothetical protein